MLHENIMNHYS